MMIDLKLMVKKIKMHKIGEHVRVKGKITIYGICRFLRYISARRYWKSKSRQALCE